MLRLGSTTIPTPAVMGILNVTPDSFSDGGNFDNPNIALRHATTMAEAGAAIHRRRRRVDSSRCAAAVSEQEELDRVVPVIEAIRAVSDVPISIDTQQGRRHARGGRRGRGDDQRRLCTAGRRRACGRGRTQCAGLPDAHAGRAADNAGQNPQYDDVVAEVTALPGTHESTTCVAAGIGEDLIVVDPGFGFGKSHQHNIELLANLRQLRVRDRPLLVGVSRKSTLGELTDRDVHERMPASVAAAVVAVMQGADIVRAHDVAATVDALKVAQAVLETGRNV